MFGHESLVGSLLARGAPPGWMEDGLTPLHAAVQNGHQGCAARLLEGGAPVGAVPDVVCAAGGGGGGRARGGV